ncbi:aldehyde dehydrogenase family protein [Lysinibacter sp. HNR]|uniref:aldehyde dehydrogenase family protein n=1 Tax=Lysinibacter sp. HNR TaxID=3031408 RepID=UPI0024348845|nr:aldehyde dehydrogenase family protein [Lysinibacter sp. HNR]WGD36854.1 aldehyde dehydrogenase family protein [Lysinibacter sp. HNR]
MTKQHSVKRDTSEIIGLLRDSFANGVTRSVAWRDQQLAGLAEMLRENSEAFESALQSDLGKSPVEGVLTEIGFLLSEIRYARSHLKSWTRGKHLTVPLALLPASARVVPEPYGTVLVIAPWNYPLMLALSPLIGVIAAGNTGVIKPSELAPHTSAAVASLIPLYLDPRAFAVVEGGVEETTELLGQKWDYIFYTGNGTVGRIVQAAAAKNLTPTTLELGGKSPVYVDDSVNLRAAAQRIVWGKLMNSGQTCVAPDYLLATPSIITKLIPLLADAVRDLYGTAVQQNPDYGRIINERHTKRLSALLEGGTVVFGGRVDIDDLFVEPTIITDVDLDSDLMTQEIFGPILPLIPVSNLDEAIAFVNGRDKPLALYVFSNDRSIRSRWIAETSSGAIGFDVPAAHLMAPGLPFGGVGESGTGNYHGARSFLTFSHEKAVLTKPLKPDTLRSSVMPPFTETKQTIIRKLLNKLS